MCIDPAIAAFSFKSIFSGRASYVAIAGLVSRQDWGVCQCYSVHGLSIVNRCTLWCTSNVRCVLWGTFSIYSQRESNLRAAEQSRVTSQLWIDDSPPCCIYIPLHLKVKYHFDYSGSASCVFEKRKCMSLHRNHYDIAILNWVTLVQIKRTNTHEHVHYSCTFANSGDIRHIGVVCGYRAHPLACHISRNNIDSIDQCHL